MLQEKHRSGHTRQDILRHQGAGERLPEMGEGGGNRLNADERAELGRLRTENIELRTQEAC